MEIIIIISLLLIILILVLTIVHLKKDLKEVIYDISINNLDEKGFIVKDKSISKDLNRLIKQINSLTDLYLGKEKELSKKSLELKKLATNISHDLRTPLTSALGYISLLQEETNKKKQEEYIQIIEGRLMRLNELINDLFDLSKLMYQKEIKLEYLDVNSILLNEVASFYDDYNSKDRKIVINETSKKSLNLVNKALLIRIFDNLIKNALKHGMDDLEIKVLENKIIFTNKFDNPKLNISNIFNEFYTTSMSRNSNSSGLGLSIVKEFMEKMNFHTKASVKNNYFIIELIFE